MGLFQVKGDALNIAGKKIPITLIGGVAAVIGVVLVLRSHQQGQRAAPAGPLPGFGGSAFAPDFSAELFNLNQQLVGIQQSLHAPAPSGPAGPSGPWPLSIAGSLDPGVQSSLAQGQGHGTAAQLPRSVPGLY